MGANPSENDPRGRAGDDSGNGAPEGPPPARNPAKRRRSDQLPVPEPLDPPQLPPQSAAARTPKREGPPQPDPGAPPRREAPPPRRPPPPPPAAAPPQRNEPIRGLDLREWWRRLSPEQRAAGIGAVLLIVSTFGPFSWVEGALILVALAILLLLRKRAQEAEFHLPFGDGTVIAASGLWCGVLIMVRLFDRPLGQGLLALACAAVLVLAGIRERAKRPADDLPTERLRGRRPRGAPIVDPDEMPTNFMDTSPTQTGPTEKLP